MQQAHDTLSALRTVLAGLDPAASPTTDDLIPTGVASGGFGLGLALRAAGSRPLVWVQQDSLDGEVGRISGAGLAAFGADPDRLVLVRVADHTGGLRAAREALRCPALGAVLVEFRGASRILDPTATRRLSFAARNRASR